MRTNVIDLHDYRNIPVGMTTKTYLHLVDTAPDVLRAALAGRGRVRGFQARHAGVCPLCRQPFTAGTWVQYGSAGVLAHPLCHRAAASVQQQHIERQRQHDAKYALRRRAKGKR